MLNDSIISMEEVPDGLHKINFDVAIRKDTWTGLGLIVRDAQWNILTSTTKYELLLSTL